MQKACIAEYCWGNARNMVEFEPFHRLLPNSTAALRRPEFPKKVKDGNTVVAAANADDSERFSVMFMDTSKRPDALKHEDITDCGSD